MRISVAQREYQRIVSPLTFLGEALLARMRQVAALTLVWILMTGFYPNQSRTTAMKASPHTFVVNQDDEEIVLKIKGDESDHWVTNQHGKKELFATAISKFFRIISLELMVIHVDL